MNRAKSSLKMCTNCVMDNSAPEIEFDDRGHCNFCTEFLTRSHHLFSPGESNRQLVDLVRDIKRDGKGKRYDCIVGVSGGLDSSWVLVQAKKLGLRPLAVHMDNGWNSELAQHNIANLIDGLNVDFFTHVIEWEEYRDLMQTFFDADVVDVELLYDNAMMAVNYQLAARYGIKYILSGTNQATEGMIMPTNWNWFKFDRRNIKSIAKASGIKKFRTFPSIGVVHYLYYRLVRRIDWVPFLDYCGYHKEVALESLEKDYGYKRYPYKHYESIFTRFYQGFILPEKFSIDKRKLHLSTLICSGQLERSSAISLLTQSPYPTISELELDKEFFLKKMNWTNEKLDFYITRPPRNHADFYSEKKLWDLVKKIRATLANKNC